MLFYDSANNILAAKLRKVETLKYDFCCCLFLNKLSRTYFILNKQTCIASHVRFNFKADTFLLGTF